MALLRRRRNSNGEEEVELKLTPMIDVVFQLLIFFLCATKFPEPEGVLKSWLPKNKGQANTLPDIDPGSVRLILRMVDGTVTCEHEDPSSPTGFSVFPAAQVRDFQTGRDEIVPNWQEVERYLAQAKANYKNRGVGTKGLPVILDFGEDVPWKYVVELLDICTGLGIKNLQISAPELPYDSG